MVEEQRVPEEKGQVNEHEATPQDEQAATTSETPMEVKEQLAQQVKACVIEGKSCRGLGDKFDEVARKLGVFVDELIDEVFELAKAEEG